MCQITWRSTLCMLRPNRAPSPPGGRQRRRSSAAGAGGSEFIKLGTLISYKKCKIWHLEIFEPGSTECPRLLGRRGESGWPTKQKKMREHLFHKQTAIFLNLNYLVMVQARYLPLALCEQRIVVHYFLFLLYLQGNRSVRFSFFSRRTLLRFLLFPFGLPKRNWLGNGREGFFSFVWGQEEEEEGGKALKCMSCQKGHIRYEKGPFSLSKMLGTKHTYSWIGKQHYFRVISGAVWADLLRAQTIEKVIIHSGLPKQTYMKLFLLTCKVGLLSPLHSGKNRAWALLFLQGQAGPFFRIEKWHWLAFSPWPSKKNLLCVS